MKEPPIPSLGSTLSEVLENWLELSISYGKLGHAAACRVFEVDQNGSGLFEYRREGFVRLFAGIPTYRPASAHEVAEIEQAILGGRAEIYLARHIQGKYMVHKIIHQSTGRSL